MRVLNYSTARANLAGALDSATDDLEEVVITRPGRPDAVLVARSELQGWKETVHLLSSPANAERLLASIARIRAGRVVRHELIEVDDE